ncbi:MAG: hypothetical protein A2167_03640 [Planctomycetes bacterium RBG_13_46_10]|nr:MAG: hypothetical protein A2167_03640 [Planctomycetes bacterium RBG_13_46_10]
MQFAGLFVSILLTSAPLETHKQGKVVKMGQQSRDSRKQKDSAIKKIIDDFVNGLSDEHRMLVILKSQLYDNTWEPMLDDLRHRLEGKPYIFKLVNRIEDDIKRIEQMRKFETEHNIDLADYVNLP